MKRLTIVMTLFFVLVGCSSNVRFIQTDEDYVIRSKPESSSIIFRYDHVERPHRVIGVIAAQLGKRARRPELNSLIMKKAREIGADGVMLVEYDVDRSVYLEQHHTVVGRGPWRRHVVGTHRRVVTEKTASAIAFVFQ